jgi:hypothetical protein
LLLISCRLWWGLSSNDIISTNLWWLLLISHHRLVLILSLEDRPHHNLQLINNSHHRLVLILSLEDRPVMTVVDKL